MTGEDADDPRLEALFGRAMLLDLETGRDGRLHEVGARYGDRALHRSGHEQAAETLAALDEFAADAACVLGHNLLGHDMPTLQALAPSLSLLRLPVIDTLFLSPLAFPENPYHPLVKNYKRVRDGRNDPVADADLAARIFREEWRQFASVHGPDDQRRLAVYRYCFARGELAGAPGVDGAGMAGVFAALGAPLLADGDAADHLHALWSGKVCSSAADVAVRDVVGHPAKLAMAAYVTAWLGVAGANSVLPPWVRHRFPAVRELLWSLRDAPCNDARCAWCAEAHSPISQLKRWFGFPAYRKTPTTADGESQQQAIVARGMRGTPLLGILPTGGGKSLCFQVPALARHYRRGFLTVVISPLQALMKDQVDNLVRKTETQAAAAIYGMQTPPERADVFERVRLGDVALLYVSPEQLRNASFKKLLLQRDIGAWVFDEAHCLSKWGHDFRPDYLYASHFIAELAREQGEAPPPVACYTATAKTDVVEEVVAHFRDHLGQELTVFRSSVERPNLSFEVRLARALEKEAELERLLQEHLSCDTHGGAVVYASTRRRTEALAEQLVKKGWSAAYFHAGMRGAEKKAVQDAFIAGEHRVVCATNAFGMGIDKEDVRLVVHVDIPGSLEAYMQEAGRAGRDLAPAHCVLLYDENDVEEQFRRGAHSTLSRKDIAEILRALKRARHGDDAEVVLTTHEILRRDELDTSFEAEDPSADTKVKTAVAWLERAGFVERAENSTRVFDGKPAVKDMEDAERRVAGLGLQETQRRRWLAILQALLEADVDETLTADDLVAAAGIDVRHAGTPKWDRGDTPTMRLMRTLHDMAKVGLLTRGPQLTAFVRHKVVKASRKILDDVCSVEAALIDVLREEAPDAEAGQWLDLALRVLNQRLRDLGHEGCNVELVRILLGGLARDGRGMAGQRASLELRQTHRDGYRVALHRSWRTLGETAELRRAVALRVLDAILGKVPDGTAASAELLVAFGTEELAAALRQDMVLASRVSDELAASERALVFLHETGVLQLQQGLAVFRQAMTIRLLPHSHGRGFRKADYLPLAYHYAERIVQVHVMGEYARLGVQKIGQALAFVSAYFTMGETAFLQRYFGDRKRELERATTAESYRRIVDALGNAAQQRIVTGGEEQNMLVLAGPGSGKTRVVVHRCAYLVRVLRVPARSVLVCCFNRNAAVELRRRLAALLGDDARGLTVQTYHGLAMRLTGTSLAARASNPSGEVPDFDALIEAAVQLLEGGTELVGTDPDALRDRLLAGYRYILVDEYQDIDAAQYRLVAALAGRTLGDSDGSLTILAVGDDDQNIYSFRGTNVEFIRRFKADYGAEVHYLVECFRSSGNIVAAAASVISHNRDRMKAAQPMVVDRLRLRHPPGGEWERLDPVSRGRVQLLDVLDAARQAAAVVSEMYRLRGQVANPAWSDFAVLGRTHASLHAIRAVCDAQEIPVSWRDQLPPLTRVREIADFLAGLRAPRDDGLSVEELRRLVQSDTAWSRILARALDALEDEAGSTPVPVPFALEFLYEYLYDLRRDQSQGDGAFIGTVHAAKGMEFRHVLIADGAWTDTDSEAERRLFFVGMTRARETLTLMRQRGAGNAYLASLDGDWLTRRAVEIEAPPENVVARRFSLIGMRDLDLSYAGSFPSDNAIHSRLRALGAGAPVALAAAANGIVLRDSGGQPVARLSRRAADEWRPRLNHLVEARVVAMVRRTREDGDPTFRDRCKVESWELPLCEVIHVERRT